MTDTAPAAGRLAGSTLVQNVPILLRVGVEGKWLADKSGGNRHHETLPCFTSVSSSVMVVATGEDEGLQQLSRMIHVA